MSLFLFSSHGGWLSFSMFLVLSQNASSAHSVGASVEELTCSKNQRWDWRHLIGVNGGDVLCFHQCMLGNVNTPASPVEHTFYGMTGWGYWGSATTHEGWKDLSPPHQAIKSQPCHCGQFTPVQLSCCIHFALGNRARFHWEEQVSTTRKFYRRIFERDG